MKLHRDLGISRKSPWHLAHRIRACWERDQGLFAGPVEVDETYVGGKERNKHEIFGPRRARNRLARGAPPPQAGFHRGMRGGLSNPSLVKSAGRFDSDAIPPPPCPPRPHSNDPS